MNRLGWLISGLPQGAVARHLKHVCRSGIKSTSYPYQVWYVGAFSVL